MKKSVGSVSRIKAGLIMLILAMVILAGCEKMNNMTGTSTGTGGSKSPGANEVVISGMAFSPASITVTVNTTVTWTNNDGVGHTVTSDAGAFDSGNIPNGGTYSLKFTAAGTYPYHCTPHPYMKAEVKVN